MAAVRRLLVSRPLVRVGALFRSRVTPGSAEIWRVFTKRYVSNGASFGVRCLDT